MQKNAKRSTAKFSYSIQPLALRPGYVTPINTHNTNLIILFKDNVFAGITTVGRPRQRGFGPVNRVFPVNGVRARLTGGSVDRVAVWSTGLGRLTGSRSG